MRLDIGRESAAAVALVAGAFSVAGSASAAVRPSDLAPQTIVFTSPTPTSFSAGATYTIAASGGSSGEPVIFSSASPNICAVNGNVVSYLANGDCTIDANQAGNGSYLAAPTVSQTFAVHVSPFPQPPSALPSTSVAPTTTSTLPQPLVSVHGRLVETNARTVQLTLSCAQAACSGTVHVEAYVALRAARPPHGARPETALDLGSVRFGMVSGRTGRFDLRVPGIADRAMAAAVGMPLAVLRINVRGGEQTGAVTRIARTR